MMVKAACGAVFATALAIASPLGAADLAGRAVHIGQPLYAYHLPRRIFAHGAPCRIGDYPRSTTTAQPLRVLYNMPASCLGFPLAGIELMRLPHVPASTVQGAYPIGY